MKPHDDKLKNMNLKNAITILIMVCGQTLFAQIIWIENFSTHPTGTTTDPGRWAATTAGHCDGETLPSTIAGNFWGVDATTQEFRCNDIEGTTCCGTTGASNNVWITNSIPIGGYANISISIDSRVIGAVECAACGSGGDLFIAAYSIDGAAFVNFDTICGAASGFNNSDCIDVGTGANLVIRVTLGNQANDENYYFDNVIVDATPCNPLPVQLESFELNCVPQGNVIAVWQTASEINNDYFILQGSTDAIYYGNICQIDGQGNSNIPQQYSCEFNNIESYSYFRLQQFDFNGDLKTYNPLYLDCRLSSDKPSVNFQNGLIHIHLTEGYTNSYDYKIYDLHGRIICNGHLTGTNSSDIPFATEGSNSLYILELLNNANGNSQFVKFIAQ